MRIEALQEVRTPVETREYLVSSERRSLKLAQRIKEIAVRSRTDDRLPTLETLDLLRYESLLLETSQVAPVPKPIRYLFAASIVGGRLPLESSPNKSDQNESSLGNQSFP